MTKGVLWTFGILRLISRGLSVVSAQAPQQLSSADKIRAGDALFVLFRQSQGFADTPESKAIEAYLQKIGDKSHPNAHRKPPYKFPLDPHPGFRSAVGYPGGQIVWVAEFWLSCRTKMNWRSSLDTRPSTSIRLSAPNV